MNDSLKDKIRRLHMPGILQTADMRAEQAEREHMSYMEFLEVVINDEHLSCSRNRHAECSAGPGCLSIRRSRNSTFPGSRH